MKGILIAAILTAFSGALAQTPSPSSSSSSNPCAVLSASAQAQGNSSTFKPSEVLACLQNVPLNSTAASAQIDWLLHIIQFQTTLAFLDSPPAEYDLPPVDIVGGLLSIQQDVQAGNYGNEYDFELDVRTLIALAGDGHFAYKPFMIGAFVYNRTVSLVSISLDGFTLPKIYTLGDIEGLANARTSASAVKTINGQDVFQYLTAIGYLTQNQDLDAEFNSLLFNPVTFMSDPSFLASQFTVADDTVILGFENGTTSTFAATVLPAPGLTLDVQSGQGFYDTFLQPEPIPEGTDLITEAIKNAPGAPAPNEEPEVPSTSNTSASPSASATRPTPVAKGFPIPDVASGKLVSGYLLNGNGTRDAAVLKISTFLAPGEEALTDFSGTVHRFLDMCRTQNKKQLIIDVRGNGGGNIVLGFDTFKQLFPNEVPYSGVRTRLSDAGNAIGEIASSLPQAQVDNAIGGIIFDAPSFLRSPDGEYYEDWNELRGPIQQQGDNFTKVASFEFFDAAKNFFFSSNYTVDGYGNKKNNTMPVFPSNAVTLLTDGVCGSTCAIFANLLINQGRVTTVTAGGRPNNNTISVIGSTQGANVAAYEREMRTVAAVALQGQENSTLSQEQKDHNTDLLYPLLQPPPINYFPDGTGPQINLLDNVAAGDASMTPLQFKRSPQADCRMWYMPRDIVSVENTWTRVINGLRDGGRGLCVNGGLARGRANGTTGGGAGPSASSAPPRPSGSSTAAFTGAASRSGVGSGLVAIVAGMVGLMAL